MTAHREGEQDKQERDDNELGESPREPFHGCTLLCIVIVMTGKRTKRPSLLMENDLRGISYPRREIASLHLYVTRLCLFRISGEMRNLERSAPSYQQVFSQMVRKTHVT